MNSIDWHRSILYTHFILKYKVLIAKCFKSVQIISFRAYREGPMPILQFALEIALTLCALGNIKLMHKT